MTVPVDTWTDKVMRFKVQEDRYDADSNYCKSLLLSLGYGNGSGINYIKELWISDLILYEITEDEYNATSYTPVGYNDIDNYVSGNNSISIKNKNFFEIETPDYIAHYAWDGYGNGTYTQLDNGYEFTDRFRAIAFEFDNLTVGEKYTLSFNVVATSNVTCGVGQNKNRGNTETSSSKNYSVTTTTSRQFFTFTATTTNRLAFNSGNVTPNTITITDIQLEKGEQDTSYLVHQENNYPISLARIPSEYQEVEYIESTGTQKIDTGEIRDTANTYRYKGSFNYSNITTRQLHGAQGSFYIGVVGGYYQTGQGGTSHSTIEAVADTFVDFDITFDTTSGKATYTINGTSANNNCSFSNTPSYAHIFIFSLNDNTLPSSCKVSHFELYKNGILIRNYIPCYRKSDNVIGMYDTVGRNFYTNAGTGTFLKGNDVGNDVTLSNEDKLWNNNGTWQLNETAITDNYLLTQLQALENIGLYDNLCYVDWVGSKEPTMTLQYSSTEDFGTKFIITEDGKKIRTDWRKLGRRKKWMMK